MGDPARKQEQAAALRQLADRIEHGGVELPDILLALLNAPIGPAPTGDDLKALDRAKAARANNEPILTLDDADKILNARDRTAR